MFLPAVVDFLRRERLLQADNILTTTNVYLLRGVIELGRLLGKAPKDVSSACMSAADVWHTYVCYYYYYYLFFFVFLLLLLLQI